MSRRRRNLLTIGVAVLLAAWFAWKVVLTSNKIPTPAAPTQQPR